jgi:hypothetical protein
MKAKKPTKEEIKKLRELKKLNLDSKSIKDYSHDKRN